MPPPFVGSILGALISGLLSAGVAFYIFRQQSTVRQSQVDKDKAEAEERRVQDRKQAISVAVDVLYKDLGTLVHHCLNNQHDDMLKQLTLINERKQRGEYDLTLTPQPMHQYWQTVHSLAAELPFGRTRLFPLRRC